MIEIMSRQCHVMSVLACDGSKYDVSFVFLVESQVIREIIKFDSKCIIRHGACKYPITNNVECLMMFKRSVFDSTDRPDLNNACKPACFWRLWDALVNQIHSIGLSLTADPPNCQMIGLHERTSFDNNLHARRLHFARERWSAWGMSCVCWLCLLMLQIHSRLYSLPVEVLVALVRCAVLVHGRYLCWKCKKAPPRANVTRVPTISSWLLMARVLRSFECILAKQTCGA